MEVKRLITGIIKTNTYLLKEENKYIIIDPAGRAEKIMQHIDAEVVAILLTHGHFDHIKAVDDLVNEYHCPIYLNDNDLDLVLPEKAKINNCFMGLSASISNKTNNIVQGTYNITPFNFEVYETPGHTKGSVIYVFEDAIFTGDTLFKGSVGRTDLYGGNNSVLRQSLRVFKTFDKKYTIYPGHEDFSTLEEELANNPYL